MLPTLWTSPQRSPLSTSRKAEGCVLACTSCNLPQRCSCRSRTTSIAGPCRVLHDFGGQNYSICTQNPLDQCCCLRELQYAVELESGDDHWERSLIAAKKAREQAMIVERESQATHAKLLAAQEATRNFEKARREHMAIQVCLLGCCTCDAALMYTFFSDCFKAHLPQRCSRKATCKSMQDSTWH
jgi:hypothetical protein